MKVYVLMTLLVAFTTPKGCDPSNFRAEYYSDEKCLDMRDDLTQKAGTIKKSDYHLYSGNCEKLGKNMSVKMSCPGGEKFIA